ncbi:MAG: vitamin K epoxide reductase family protein [Akkermansiaceae bacterium]
MHGSKERVIRIIAALLFTISGLAAAYLLAVSIANGPVAGCGEGSSCSSVLKTRFAYFLPGIPITAVALPVYALLVAGLLIQARSKIWDLMIYTGSLIVLFAAIYFVGIQVVKLKQLCWWCMGMHLLGSSGALLVLARIGIRQPKLLMTGIGIAAMAMLLTVVCQYLKPQKTTVTTSLGEKRLSGAGKIVNIDGLELDLNIVPFRGNPDSSRRMVILFDYSCSGCRRVHGYLSLAENRYGADNYLVVMLPVPLNPDCNPFFEEKMPEHRDSCTFVKMALAIWATDPEKFYEFDRWMIETGSPSYPPLASEARAKAEKLIGKERLDELMRNPDLDVHINNICRVYNYLKDRSGRDAMPKMIMGNGKFSEGAPYSQFALFEMLEAGIGVKKIDR